MAKRKTKQQFFFKEAPAVFGGKDLKSHPKDQRPVNVKHPMHVILHSRHAKLDWSFRKKEHLLQIEACVRKQLRDNGIKNYGLQIMSNHIHMNLRFPSRRAYQSFIRAVAGIIPRIVMGCERGMPALTTKFWTARPLTKIIGWGRQFKKLKEYFELNRLEAFGFSLPYARAILESTA